MDGTAELLQLAHLLRVIASTARDIATIQRFNVTEIGALALQAETIATDFETITKNAYCGRQSEMAKLN